MKIAGTDSSENTLESRDHHNDKDKCAVQGDEHVQGVRDIVAPPLTLHLRLFDLSDGVLGLSLERIALPCCQVLLLAQVVIVEHDLGALVLACLCLKLIDHESLSQQWIGQFSPLMLQIDKHR